ncbi:2Fe-2S iron-sulfur cluster binding domain-containing protein (plasmid) [Haloferax mediterranei ATCC 33500]|uniref:2Fe-2S iron-sulfur cluster binding domain-containing protein n=1 Tax=Haloferax mediterranei (strain ATCC 33500 / DSM 1411 / JCM 8866 / NBRC 14739 / NCIMB 2177 / R-4) TaxID=523841 RepID=I3R9R1_HALMT|nr:2Fe-2S iron-sulfur cluster-binding protein [Haloferax mediterranei]AFK20971.1 ferredoxin [Haloferax mediterranei ATCC 33500]AHZ24165.1 ferredoxin [Haloferax mediterranei ATCC 33500]EMA05242.1 ferredoxin [Haloferax mediterranei ATCC 33500]MDX5989954.1 2Fe-2S iron-sulfur cluster-binding protein [Haloferax mediterranei ATCC 33500]QCQ77142.1 2Fe-2S iron-sulfur cluster binding domain-containing protein [Haloferax mediterranei ATCC 33500]
MATRHDLTLTWRDGREETVPASENETVLEAAESAGIGLPFGCRTGACATCVGRLIDGAILYDRPPRALKTRHIEAGYVLCCIARPRTDCRIEVGADVQTDLVSNPWK